MNVEEFKKLYAEIGQIALKAQDLFATASTFIDTGVQILANEYDYSFVQDIDFRARLQDACKRMLTARIGFLHPDAEVAFEDLSRNVHLQLEGLANCWFNQWYITQNSGISNLRLSYVLLKAEQQFRMKFSNGIKTDQYDNFTNTLAKKGKLFHDFCSDYIDKEEKEFTDYYESDFKSVEIDLNDFKKRVWKDFKCDKVERTDFSIKSEFIFLQEKGVQIIFTDNPIVRLSEFRNALLSHMGGPLDHSKKYYKELVGKKEDRMRILIQAFDSFYKTVQKRLS